MKLRLFALRDTQTNKTLPDTFFPSKSEAKRMRDQLNSTHSAANYVVTPGPDHHKYRR